MCILPPLRQVFPCGLVQPSGSFRASVDALLLARFATIGQGFHFVDLGTGCGIVACAVALAHPHTQGLGLEREPVLVQAAQQNIAQLGLEAQLACAQADIAHSVTLHSAGLGSFDAVLTNPPYRIAGQGRPAAQALRKRALEGNADSLGHFFAAGAALLRHHGYFSCVLAAARLGDAMQLLRRHNMGLRRLCCVHSAEGGPATRILVEARKNAAEDVTIEPPVLAAQVAACAAQFGAEDSAAARNAVPFCVKPCS